MTRVRARQVGGWALLPLQEISASSDGFTQMEVVSFADRSAPPEELEVTVSWEETEPDSVLTLRPQQGLLA